MTFPHLRCEQVAKPTGKPLDIDAVHAEVQRRFPKTLEALRQSERADEAKVATFFADPRWPEIRQLVERIAPGAVAPIEAVVQRVRREQWKDFS